MELRVLRYFLAVAREESISAAAEYLHITQPTLSRQLIDLEEDLDVTLLIRGKKNHKIQLTKEGLLLKKRAEEIIELTNKTEAELREKDIHIAGEIFIGGGETDAMRFVARTARQLQRQYPLIHYHLYSGNADDVMERLDKGLLDFGIVIEPANMEKYDYIQFPETDTWGLLLRSDHPLAAKSYIAPQDLLDSPLIISRQTAVENKFSAWFGKDYKKIHVAATYNLVFNASLMVEEGFGVAFCLDKLIHTDENSLLTFRPLKPAMEAPLNLIWKKSQIFSPAAEIFLEELKKIPGGKNPA